MDLTAHGLMLLYNKKVRLYTKVVGLCGSHMQIKSCSLELRRAHDVKQAINTHNVTSKCCKDASPAHLKLMQY